MCEHCSSPEALVDAAIVEGRVHAGARESLIKAFEHVPDLIVETLSAATPDTIQAGRNYAAALTDEEDAAYRADFERRFFVPAAQVV